MRPKATSVCGDTCGSMGANLKLLVYEALRY